MSEGDLDSSIQDYMLFGSGAPPVSSTAKISDDNIEHVPQQDEISGHDPLCPKMVSSKCRCYQFERSVSDSGTYFSSHCISTHNKSKMQISPVEKVGSEVDTTSYENYGSTSLPEFRNNEAWNEDIILTKNRKFDVISEISKRQERQLMIDGDHSNETYTFNLRPRKYEHFGKTVDCSKAKEFNETKEFASNLSQNLFQKGMLTGPTMETIQGLERHSFNINSNLHPAPEIENELEPQTFDPYYTCWYELQNGDQLTINNDFETCVSLPSITDEVETKITPGDMKKPDEASNSSLGQDYSHCLNSLHVSYNNEERENNDPNTHLSSLNDGEISIPYNHVSTKVTDAASSMDVSSLNADSLCGDGLEQDLDSEASDKVSTHVITKDALMILKKGGTVEKLMNPDDKERINWYSLNKTDERYSLSESLFNTNNGWHSNKSAASDVSADNTQVKELSDNYEMSILNEDYVEHLSRHDKINRSSVNDIRNTGIESNQTPQYAEDPQHKFNANILGSQSVVPEQSVQSQDINYTYPQHVNEYTSEKYNLPSAPENEIQFQQGTNRLLVGDFERSMEDSFVIDAEVHRNGRSDESVLYELANEFRNVRVDAFNAHHSETDLAVNHSEHYDHDLFGGPVESRFHQTRGMAGMSSTVHHHSLENISMLPQNEKTQEIIPSAEVTLPVASSHHSINETSNLDSSGWENNISGQVTVPIQAISQSLSYESLHGDQERPTIYRQTSYSTPPSQERPTIYRQTSCSTPPSQERPMIYRQTSCSTPPSETNSFDEEQQRDLEYAMELQRQLNHEIFMEDEAFARHLDNSQRQTLSPPEYSSRRTEFFLPRVEEMINLNPQRRQHRQQHSNRHRRRRRSETSPNRDGQSNREPSPEGMISVHENISGHTHHSHETSQGSLQQRGGIAGANVADSGMPVDSDFQNVRHRSRRVSNRDRPHRFDQGLIERVERIPGQSAQIDPSAITPLTLNYQEERRRREERRRLLEARQWEHQNHYQHQNWRTGLDLLPNEDYPSLDVHPSFYDPDQVFEIEDGEQRTVCQYYARSIYFEKAPNDTKTYIRNA
ncbi:hypothetical protein ACJMK2_038580 [Sinanodonta woodiana]|uniref:Uncharacterized protein n=1 Tax=Sinanodonta woodiana TaxID=1069815 RepID=A0ABD3WA99_SINWO